MLTCGGAHAVGAPAAALDDFARFAISDAIGREDEAYRARPSGADIEWRNPDQSMTFLFTAQSVRVRSHERSYTWRLTSVGRDANSIEFDAARPALAAPNRVAYEHGVVTDWYANGPFGVQHGVTIPRRPFAGAAALFVELSMAADDDALEAVVAADGSEVTFRRGTDTVFRYGPLVVFDADGKRLGARLVDAASGPGAVLRIVIDDTGARYPVTIDPFIQKAVLEPSDGERIDAFGWSVAADGDTVVVGAPGRSVGPNEEQGAAYIFEKPPGGWRNGTQTAVLTASNGAPFDWFGYSVAVSGATVVVGAPTREFVARSQFRRGAVYLFERPPGGWVDSTESFRMFEREDGAYRGSVVAIDGDVVATISTFDTVGRVEVRPAGGWQDLQVGESFRLQSVVPRGVAHAIAIEGDTIVVGAPRANVDGVESRGNVVVFSKPQGGWPLGGALTNAAALRPSDGGGGRFFGRAVAISGDEIAVGMPGRSGDGSPQAGAVYVYRKGAAEWVDSTEAVRLEAGLDIDLLGYDVAMVGDSVLAVGRWVSDATMFVFQFDRPAGGWAGPVAGEVLVETRSQLVDLLTLYNEIPRSMVVTEGAIVLGERFKDRTSVWQRACSGARNIAIDRWELFGLPCKLDAGSTVEAVMGDDLDPLLYTARWAVYAYDDVAGAYHQLGLSDVLETGRGYWITSLDAAAIDVDGDLPDKVQGGACASADGCFEILLEPPASWDSGRFQMVGHAWLEDIPWRDVRVVTPDGTAYTPSAAHAAQIMLKSFFKHDGSGYVEYDDITIGQRGSLLPFDGFWVRTLPAAPAGTRLLIPASAVTLPPEPGS